MAFNSATRCISSRPSPAQSPAQSPARNPPGGTIMDATATEHAPIKAPPHAARARIGMIIPSVNSMTEPQFNRLAPPGLGVHVARARVAGPWKRPLADMAEEIAASARLLSDVAPDLIVFHCTDTSMTQGPQGEGRI